MSHTRRHFLKGLGTTSLLPLIPGCATLDRMILGETQDEREKVVILGAGIAGLTAAYQLKKIKLPYRVFEGSRRAGGRALTVQDVTDTGQNVDLGAEKIFGNQTQILALCKELKVGLSEIRKDRSFSYWNEGRFVGDKDSKKFYSDLQNFFSKLNLLCYGKSQETVNRRNRGQFPQAVQLDSVSALEFIDKNKDFFTGWKKDWILQWVRSHWGVEPKELSGLGLLHGFRDEFFAERSKNFKISGGFSALAQSLLEQVAGVIPGRMVQFEHKLVEIEVEESEYVLTFETPQGKEEYRARHIINTIPWKILKKIKGFSDLIFQSDDLEFLKRVELGSQSRVALTFKSPVWTQSRWITSLASQSFSEGGTPPANPMATPKGVLVAQFGGLTGQTAGLESVPQVLADLKSMGVATEGYENQFYVQNWSQFPWSQGSRAYPRIGAYQSSAPEHLVAGTWVFAGDGILSAHLGTAEGAVLSAQRAVQLLSRFRT